MDSQRVNQEPIWNNDVSCKTSSKPLSTPERQSTASVRYQREKDRSVFSGQSGAHYRSFFGDWGRVGMAIGPSRSQADFGGTAYGTVGESRAKDPRELQHETAGGAM